MVFHENPSIQDQKTTRALFKGPLGGGGGMQGLLAVWGLAGSVNLGFIGLTGLGFWV